MKMLEKVIALAQTYFSVQSRSQEITEKEYYMLAEDITNLFRSFQIEQRVKRDKVYTEKNAWDTHNKIGKIVRKAIKEAARNND